MGYYNQSKGPRRNHAKRNRQELADMEGEEGSRLRPAYEDHLVNLSMVQFGYISGATKVA